MAGSGGGWAEIAKAYVTIVPTMKGSQNQIAKELGAEVKAAGDSGGKQLGSGILASIKNIAIGNVLANGITNAFGTVKDAVTSVFTEAFNGFAANEQLVGGVETLFKGASDKVIANANAAFSTAGLTANQYMETVTSFSASLIASLDGDYNKAADLSNRAITDMSDNANKMGSSMESIQNAYAGFAKQNYTMLDNLNKMGALAA